MMTCEPIKKRSYSKRKTVLSVTERVFRRVNITDKSKCWLWPGPLNNAGYGLIRGNDGIPHMMTVHRAIAKYHLKWDIEGKDVQHTCTNNHCVNPDHLKLGDKETRYEKFTNHPIKDVWKNPIRECPYCKGKTVFTWFSRKHKDCYLLANSKSINT